MFDLSFIHQILVLLLGAEPAHAQVSGVITSVGNGLINLPTGFTGISGAIIAIIDALLAPIGVFFVVRAGLTLVISQAEDKLEKAKRTIASTLVAIMLVLISQQIVAAFFALGTNGLPSSGPAALALQINGIIDWVLVLVGVLGALMIVVAAIKIVANFGKDQGVAEIRKAVFAVAAGILMLLLRPAINATIGLNGAPDATAIVGAVAVIIGNLLMFLALVVVVIIIYAGVSLLLNFGNEEQFTKSRGLIFRAIIGLVVIVISFALTMFIANLVAAN
jgi:hypothetical protein